MVSDPGHAYTLQEQSLRGKIGVIKRGIVDLINLNSVVGAHKEKIRRLGLDFDVGRPIGLSRLSVYLQGKNPRITKKLIRIPLDKWTYAVEKKYVDGFDIHVRQKLIQALLKFARPVLNSGKISGKERNRLSRRVLMWARLIGNNDALLNFKFKGASDLRSFFRYVEAWARWINQFN
jgi:hypothetical protein